jgi:hypothetical protein
MLLVLVVTAKNIGSKSGHLYSPGPAACSASQLCFVSLQALALVKVNFLPTYMS